MPSEMEKLFAGWRRLLACMAAGVLPASGTNSLRCLSDGALEMTLEANHELVQAALPVMREYASCFGREGGLLVLLSLDGTLLTSAGAPHLEGNPVFRPGVMLEGECEEPRAAWECRLEPVLGGKNRPIGCLCLLLPRGNFHAAFPQLLSAMAADIHNQHHLHDLLSDQSAVLELLSAGIVILDRQGGIKAANAHARRMLGIPGDESISLGPVSAFVKDGQPFMQILGRRQAVMDEEVTLQTGRGEHRYILSASFIPEDKGVVCTLAEASRMQKFAVRTAGSKAIYRFSDILGQSDIIVNAVQLAKIAAQSDITTLLLGESGTGKELFAHAIHNGSSRHSGPFVVVNCGALPRDLVQAELFGYESGAFTGAARNGKPGKFELADGGTIFLDEIGEMPMEAQTNLLRLIQNREISRVGGTTTRSVDVRIVAATNKNLRDAVAAGTFRSDLYYRLGVLIINIPSLRDRAQDITLLATHFLRKYASVLNRPITEFAPKALQALMHYSWPGNIRELENIVERAVNLAGGARITEADLPGFLPAGLTASRMDQPGVGFAQNGGQFAPQARESGPAEESGQEQGRSQGYTGSNLYQREYQTIVDTLDRCNGNIRLTAQELGIARSALYGKLTRFGIDYTSFRRRYRQR
ncbi:MAG: sigma 54-interacting transcriptional regulator [Desulfovibrionaceae bacterium]|nr:sigma 54-interacting transcriptional regulator [Desulfovibrionaceae bacterium]